MMHGLLDYSLPYSLEAGPLTEPRPVPVTSWSLSITQSWGYKHTLPCLAFYMGDRAEI